MNAAEVAFKAVAAALLAGLAFVLLAARPRRRATLALVAFLVLVGANQAIEAARAARPAAEWEPAAAVAAAVAAALDPFALYAFAAAFPEGVALRRRGRAAAVLVPGLLLAGTAPWLAGGPATPAGAAHDLALSAYTTAVYLLVLAFSARAAASGDSGGGWRPFVAAASVVALLRLALLPLHAILAARVLVDAHLAGWRLHVDPLTLHAVGTFLALAGWLAPLLLARGGARPALLRPALPGLALALVFTATGAARDLAARGALPDAPILSPPVGDWAPVRWLLFGTFASMAILRHHLLGLDLASRRRLARVLLGSGFLVLGLLLVTLGERGSGGAFALRGVDYVVLAVALAASQGFLRLVDWTAERLFRIPGAERDAPGGPLHVGAVLSGRYRLTSLLGAGSGGRVFLARDDVLGRAVVVKDVPVPPGDSGDVVTREARIAGSLAHPHVLVLHDAVQRPGGCALVSEYAEGGSLAALVAREGPLPLARGMRLMEDVLDGLAHVHRRGVIHRDLKPSNVLLTQDGNAKLSDFGIARLGREDATRVPGAPVGTPGHMAPEQARGEPATPATDVYAAGLLARRCIRSPLPPALERVVAKALREAPLERWPDGQAMAEAWKAAQAR